MPGILEALRTPSNQAVLVFFVGYVYICAAKRFRVTVLWVGVVLLLLLGVYQPAADSPYTTSVWNLLCHINWNVLMILAGAMVVAQFFIQSRVPVLLADLIVKHLKTVGGAALGVCALSSFLSAFIDNVTTVLIVAPVALELARRLKASPVPFIIGLAISSNLQGTATLIGDPPSLILANGLRLNFLDFFFFQGKPGIFWMVQLGAVGSMLVLWVLFFRKYKAPAEEATPTRVTSWFPTWLLAAMVLALSAVSQVDIPGGEKFANGTVCVLAALVGIVWHARSRRRETADGDESSAPAPSGATNGFRRTLNTVLKVDFQTVALLAAIFALTFALSETGFIKAVAEWITSVVGANRLLTFTLIVWLSVGFSAVIDNIPYTAVMLPTVLRIASDLERTEGAPPDIAASPTHILFAFGLLVGACLGGNISPVGASANIVGVGILRKEGHDVSFWKFVGMGLPFTIAATLPAYVALWLLWG